MARPKITSKEELRKYLKQKFFGRITAQDIKDIVKSATFKRKQFLGMSVAPLNDTLSAAEMTRLIGALGNPRMRFNHIPGPQGRCVAKDNAWCADYHHDEP
jgi:hypothetical protein